jgi:serine/threonine-protein kinase
VDATHVARALGLPPGTRIGRYTLVRRVATGGMAEVYLAQLRGAERFAKLVALKLILPQFAADPEFARMFLDEARLASRLHHPNVTQVLDFGEFRGEHYITMEYVHGRHLLDLMRAHRGRALPREVALTIVSGVARALHHMHELRDHDGSPLGLVHRDVSPSNVLLSYEGAIKLTDFGIAKAVELTSATRTGAFKGKIGYASPEQCRGDAIDRRSDLFSAGILLYETTLGARAFSGPNEFAVLGRVARADYVPPEQIDAAYPASLASLLRKALALDPSERFATAAEMAEALDACAHTEQWRLSPARVVESMSTNFGDSPPLTTADESSILLRDPSAASPVLPPVAASQVTVAEPRRRGLAMVLLGAAALVSTTALAATYVLTQLGRDDAAIARPEPELDAPAVAATRTTGPEPAVAAPPASAPTSLDPPVAVVPTPSAAPVAVAPTPVASPAGAAPATPVSEPVTRESTPEATPSSDKRSKKKKQKRDKSQSTSVPVNLYPPGYRP